MRTISEIRRDDKVPILVNKDSLYRQISREKRVFRKISVPKKLQEQLPFKSKPKLDHVEPNKKQTYMYKRAVVVEPEDRAKRATIQMLSTIAVDKIAKRKLTRTARSQANAKSKEQRTEVFADAARDERKRKFRDDGKSRSIVKKTRQS